MAMRPRCIAAAALWALSLWATAAFAAAPILDRYKITYKDKHNKELQPEIGLHSIVISDPNAVGSLKIQRIKGVPDDTLISKIVTAGSLTKVYSEAVILDLRAEGTLGSLTTKKAYVLRLFAESAGKIKMSSFADSYSSHNTHSAAIYLSDPAEFPGGPGAAAAPSTRLVCKLVGVSLIELYAPHQSVNVKMSSKSWVTPAKAKAISLAYIPGVDGGAFVLGNGNSIIAGHLELLSVKGGGIWWNDDRAIAPVTIYSRRKIEKPTKIVAKGATLTFDAEWKGGATVRQKSFFSAGVSVRHILINSSALTVIASGGDQWGSQLACAGSLDKSQALAKKFRKKIAGKPYDVEYVGGKWGYVTCVSGAPTSDYAVFGVEPPVGWRKPVPFAKHDIRLIQADFGLNWEPFWAPGGLEANLYVTDTIWAGEKGDGRIHTIKSRAPTDRKLSDDVKALGGPFICGRGYAAGRGKIVGGESGYFVWFTPN